MRRLRNCAPDLAWNNKAYFLNKFASDMRFSGHTQSFRNTILKIVVARYEVELSNHLEGKKRMYRSRLERIKMKEETRVSSLKDTWFRSGGYTSTLTVPATPAGSLAEKVRRNLERGRQPKGTKTKVLEDGGRGARQGMILSNQFPRESCSREDCQLCLQQDGDNRRIVCDKENIGYEGRCSRCPEIIFTYIGETSKTAYTRLSQHLAAYRAASAAKLPAQPQQVGIGLDRPKAQQQSLGCGNTLVMSMGVLSARMRGWGTIK